MRKQYQPSYPSRVRKKWYFLVDKAGKSVTEICDLYDISRKTYYKWYTKDHGDHTYRPKQAQPKIKLTQEVKELIEREKHRTNYGPLKMKLLIKRRLNLNVSTTIIYRFYKRKGLIRKPQKKLPWYIPLKEPVVPEAPGDVVELDIKYVWKERKRQYQRTFVDVYTGMQYAQIDPRKDDDTTIGAYQNAVSFFPFSVNGIQTDNGGEFRGTFHQYLGKIGVAHYFIPKKSPQWNGAVERAHRSIDDEYYLRPETPWQTLTEYLTFYNTERIHLGKYLNGLTPMEKYAEWRDQSVTPGC